jgi:hypothetical protein
MPHQGRRAQLRAAEVEGLCVRGSGLAWAARLLRLGRLSERAARAWHPAGLEGMHDRRAGWWLSSRLWL